MNNRIEQIAALANTAAYSQENPDKYIDGAPLLNTRACEISTLNWYLKYTAGLLNCVRCPGCWTSARANLLLGT